MKSDKSQPIIFTFDLFDTLITRTVLSPEDLFHRIGSRLEQEKLWHRKAGQFHKQRVTADTLARRKHRTEEISLHQIYEELATKADWNAEQTIRAMSIEIEEELASVRPIVEMRARWDAIDPKSKAIVSDTYFGTDVIEGMLHRCGIQCDRKHLFLSSMFCKRKSTGKLFSVVADSFKVEPGQIHHTGDNQHSDLQEAAKAGFSAELYRYSTPQRYEALLRQIHVGESSSRIQGAIRVARLSFPGGTERERTLWEVGTQIAGPILFAYVSWVLESARGGGLNHLYFLARDGQILLRLARLIDPTFQSSYLLASRQAWHLPSIVSVIDETALSWITDGHLHSSLRNVLSRVDVLPEDTSQILQAHGFDEPAWERPVKDRKQLELLFADAAFTRLVLDRAKNARLRIADYLQHEGVLASDRIGIVDLGWNGRLQRSLSLLLKEIAPEKHWAVDGFYLALKQGSRQDESGRYHAYFGPDLAKSSAQAMLLELFCSADHGGLLGFVKNSDGSIQPVLAQERDHAVIAWGLPLFHSAIVESANQLLIACEEQGLRPEDLVQPLKTPSLGLLNMLANNPAYNEADTLGQFPFTYDQKHTEVIEMAPAMAPSDALGIMLPASIRAKQRTMWIQGTLVRSLRGMTGVTLRIFRWRETLVRKLQR